MYVSFSITLISNEGFKGSKLTRQSRNITRFVSRVDLSLIFREREAKSSRFVLRGSSSSRRRLCSTFNEFKISRGHLPARRDISGSCIPLEINKKQRPLRRCYFNNAQ